MLTGENIITEIDKLFPDIVSKKRKNNLLEKERLILEKRVKGVVFQKKMGKIFQGYHDYVENDVEEELEFVMSKNIELHPLISHAYRFPVHDRFMRWESLQNIATNELLVHVEKCDHDNASKLLKQLVSPTVKIRGYIFPSLLDINGINDAGLTACHVAAYNGDLEMLNLLIEVHGANVLTNRYNYTVWAHALNSVSKGLGCTVKVLDWLKIRGVEDFDSMGATSVVAKYTRNYRKDFKRRGFLSTLVQPKCSRIVIIDDSQSYTTRLRRLLGRNTKKNVKITTFPTLESAEIYLNIYKCHLVFIDNIFPENESSTGKEFAHNLLTDKKTQPKLVLMSGDELKDVSKHKKLSVTSKIDLTSSSIRNFVKEAGLKCKKKKDIIKRKKNFKET